MLALADKNKVNRQYCHIFDIFALKTVVLEPTLNAEFSGIGSENTKNKGFNLAFFFCKY